MIIAHLTSTSSFGGPERQMLGLTESLPAPYRTLFLLFKEGGRCRPFAEQIRRSGHEVVEIEAGPLAAVRELTDRLRALGVGVLCCHGYKADLVGLPAARRAGLPVVAVSRGWTWATTKVRLYEALDRLVLRRMDRVICVSEGQAAKVRRAGVPAGRVVVIRNAIRAERFERVDPDAEVLIRGLFAEPRSRLVGAAGRLSPEKGFDQLVAAAAIVARRDPGIGFVLFGDGPLREALARQIAAEGLAGRFVLAGHRDDLDRYFPHLDLVVLPSFTEGLPNVALEAMAAGVPVVATAVGGTPEVVEDGVSGYLVPPGDPVSLARRIVDALDREEDRRTMGRRGQERVRELFTFEAQSLQYQHLFAILVGGPDAAVSLEAEAAAHEDRP